MSNCDPNYNYEKPYCKIASAESTMIPKRAMDKVLFLQNDLIQGDTPFQPQDRFTFSPLPTNPYSLEGLAIFALIANFARTKEGQKSLERIALKYIETCGSIIEAVQDASHSNWLTALNNQHITAAITHRIGLMDDASYIKIIDHYRSVFDKMFGLEIVSDTITGVTTLVQGNKVKSSTSEKGAVEETAGLVSLLSAVKALV